MRSHLARLAASVFVACALAVAPAGEAAARGVPLDAPLGVGTESPLRQLFLDVTGADARLPSRPRVAARWLMSNSWTTPTTLARGNEGAFLQLDGQADAVALSALLPWTSRLATALEARTTVWWGGWSDAPVEAWHRLGGFTNFERDDHDAGQVALALRTSRASAFDLRSAKVSFGGVALRNQLVLAQGGASLRAAPGEARARWAVSLRVDAKLPLGSPEGLGSSGGTDVGAGLLATAEVARWLVLHANAFAARWGALGRGVPMQPREYHHGAEISAALVGRRWALVVEDRLLSPVFPGDWKRFGGEVTYSHLEASAAFAATRWQNQISVGVRRGRFTAWFSEDFTIGRTAGADKAWFYNSNAPDISVGVEVAHSF